MGRVARHTMSEGNKGAHKVCAGPRWGRVASRFGTPDSTHAHPMPIHRRIVLPDSRLAPGFQIHSPWLSHRHISSRHIPRVGQPHS
jgi:hypothetical protein